MTEAILRNQRTELSPSGPGAVSANAYDIASSGACDCLCAGGPHCSMDGNDPHDILGEYEEGVREAATAAVAEAGFDTEDADIADQILDAAHHTMDLPHDALYGKPDTAPVTRRSRASSPHGFG